MSAVVTLLTDFGAREPFVGVMKGVVLGHCPTATLVDLTHEIDPQSVRAGAFWLGQAYAWFPAGTVHLAVVDPGVGSARRALVARADEHLFVAPDNGILEVVQARAKRFEAREIDLEKLGLVLQSRTFHGRDLFAPVAGLLAARAVEVDGVGPPVELVPTGKVPLARMAERAAEGEVVVVDRFGNLVTNLEGFAQGVLASATVRLLGRELRVVGTYSDLEHGECAALLGSFGQLEITVRDGSAEHELWARPGAPVRVDW